MKNGGRNSTSSTPGQNSQPYAKSLSHSGSGGGTLMDSEKERTQAVNLTNSNTTKSRTELSSVFDSPRTIERYVLNYDRASTSDANIDRGNT
ncbi:hypothetical protein LTR20_007015 [Exophiala xenobiotica]|nr:hypothetical protein LTR40_008142 [Exophiala xenobiotica]KAK5380542.1 hypothetical protein LTS13_003401 [Exophiala xenobiotica]KAK5392964.1 hypothetical protein LTR79_009867 [Exophiala xenobiotica]KAK5412019.1 hypothetical protein LTR90_007580 [Exophiala xenobiotica]KAK5460590.1 hypothetical protein LTR20_007015 [Exophiala xenobiotica]